MQADFSTAVFLLFSHLSRSDCITIPYFSAGYADVQCFFMIMPSTGIRLAILKNCVWEDELFPNILRGQKTSGGIE